MEIDWITVSAQIVNFLILVWLLKHFLYQPVIRAMERREQRITKRLSEAQERESQADEKIRHFQDKNEELERQRNEILDNAGEEAERQKRQMLDNARSEVAEIRKEWQQQANREKEEFLGNLQRQAVDAIEVIARKALTELADVELEARLVQVFIDKMKSLNKETSKALSQAGQSVRITSAFELDSTLRSRLTRAVHEQLDKDIEVDYAHDSELLCGIELTSGGRRLSWNLANYTEELTERIEEAFRPTGPGVEEER